MLISAYSTRHQHCPHQFMIVEERARWRDSDEDAQLAGHLDALADYARAVTAESWTFRTHALLRHITDTQRWYSFDLEDADPAQLTGLSGWASEANAILMVDGALLDGRGRPLLPGAHGAGSGEVPRLDETVRRAAEIRDWLAAERHVVVPVDFTPVRGSQEVRLRNADEVGLRVLALVLTSDFARSVVAGEPLNPEDLARIFPRGFAALSPAERDLLASQDADAARRAQSRIEAAQELLWTVSKITFGWPSQACSVERIERLTLTGGEQDFLQGLALRPLTDLLNEYECLVSLAWALDAARRQQHPPIPETHPVICFERLAALSWLMNPQVAWDDADQFDRDYWRSPQATHS